MIELSILDLLYLVLSFFLVVIGTLLTLVLLRVLKILSVGVEIADYYQKFKSLLVYYSMVPYVIKDKIFETFTSENQNTSKNKQAQDIQEKDPIL